jgi:hypothetical protein
MVCLRFWRAVVAAPTSPFRKKDGFDVHPHEVRRRQERGMLRLRHVCPKQN